MPFLPPPFVTLIAGRGCRYNCNYCQPAERIMFGRQVRRRSVRNVMRELEFLRGKFHFNSFMVHDDCLTEDPEWVLQFCRKIKAGGYDQPFVCQSRADLVCKHRDMVEALYDAGVRLLIVGFESGSNRVLKFLRKGCTREQNVEAARICREIGIKVWANYMMGLPTETNEEVQETFTMLQEIRPYHCSPAFYTPHPGSDLFEIGKEMGIHMITDHNSYRRNTYEPKIKGPDYDFLQEMLYKSIALGEDTDPKAQPVRVAPVRGRAVTRPPKPAPAPQEGSYVPAEPDAAEDRSTPAPAAAAAAEEELSLRQRSVMSLKRALMSRCPRTYDRLRRLKRMSLGPRS